MASIGELTATVRADVSGFVGPMQQVAATTKTTFQTFQTTSAAANTFSQSFTTLKPPVEAAKNSLTALRGTLTSLLGSLAGIPGPLGNLASKLAMFAVGGGVTVAVTAGLLAIGAAFSALTRRAREESAKTEQAVADLVTRYRERTGFFIRENVERARGELEAARKAVAALSGRGATTMGGREREFGPGSAQNQADIAAATARVNELEIAVQEAERELRNFNQTQRENGFKNLRDAAREAADAAREYEAALRAVEDAVKRAKDKGVTNTITKEQANAVVEVFDRTKPKGGDKSPLVDNEAAIQGARDAAQAMAQAFMSAFSQSKESLTERVTNVLRSAVQSAIQRLIEQKLFETFLKAFSPDKGVVTGTVLGGIGDVVGGIFGAPPPMAASSGTIIVPLDNLPAPLSPVEVARDAMHQTVWMETARVAEMNGFRLSVRR